MVAEVDEWQWHRSWLPITHDAWSQCGVELEGETRGAIVDGSFPVRPGPSLPRWLPSFTLPARSSPTFLTSIAHGG
jgi:hypothetical protein